MMNVLWIPTVANKATLRIIAANNAISHQTNPAFFESDSLILFFGSSPLWLPASPWLYVWLLPSTLQCGFLSSIPFLYTSHSFSGSFRIPISNPELHFPITTSRNCHHLLIQFGPINHLATFRAMLVLIILNLIFGTAIWADPCIIY